MQANPGAGGIMHSIGLCMCWTGVQDGQIYIASLHSKHFFEVKPDLKDVKVFGCLCYVLVHPQDHLHLEPRVQRAFSWGLMKKDEVFESL